MKFSIESVFKAVDQMSGPLSRMESRVRKFSKVAGAAVSKADRAASWMGQGLQAVTGAAVVAGGAIGAVGVNVIQTGAKFEKSLMGAAARFPGIIKRGSKEYLALRDAALKTGAVTEFTAQQTAEALTSLAQAGFTANQAIATLPGVVDLATAAEVDLGAASQMAADSLAAAGMMTTDTAKLTKNLADVMDTMSAVANASTTSLTDLYETIQAGAGVSLGAGANLHEFLAMAGTIAPVAKGEKAGMMLKNMFLNLSAAVGPGAKQLERMGFSASKMGEELQDPIAFLKKFRDRLKGASDKRLIIRQIIGKEALPGFQLLLDNIDALEAMKKATDNATGSSKVMAEAMRQTLQGSMDILRSSIEGVSLAVFFLYNKDLEKLINKVNEWIVATGKVIKANEDIVKNLGGDFAKGIKDAVLIIGGLIAAFVALKGIVLIAQAAQIAWGIAVAIGQGIAAAATGVLWLMEAAVMGLNMAMWANPVGLIIAGIVVLIAIVVLAIVFWKQWTRAVVNFFKAVGGVFSWLWTAAKKVGEVIGDLWFRFSSILKALGLLSRKVKTEVEVTETRRAKGAAGTSAVSDSPEGGAARSTAATGGAQMSTRHTSITEQKATLWVRPEKGAEARLAGGNGKGQAPAPFKLQPSGGF